MIDFIVTHVRYWTFGAGAIVFILMTRSSIVRRKYMSRRVRRIWFWFYLLVGFIIYGTADNISDHIRLNPPTFGFAITLTGLAAAIIYSPADDEEKPPDDHSVSTRFVNWLDNKVVMHKDK